MKSFGMTKKSKFIFIMELRSLTEFDCNSSALLEDDHTKDMNNGYWSKEIVRAKCWIQDNYKRIA